MRSRKTHDVIFGIIDVYIVTAVVVKLLTLLSNYISQSIKYQQHYNPQYTKQLLK